MIIDTHSHLYSNTFNTDREEAYQRARDAGVERIYLPAIDSESTEAMLALESAHPDTCFAMMGLHPCSVNAGYEQELDHVQQWLERRDFVAIGEIGLDFYWDTTYKEEQYKAFERQMTWALEKGKPIVIHTRNAMAETIERVKPFAEKGLRGIFHCFGGTMEEADQITGMGFYLGIGGVLTYKKSGLAASLKDISPEWLVLETDAPYLSPVPYRGKRNEPAYLVYVLAELARVKGLTEQDIALITTQNAKNIFGN